MWLFLWLFLIKIIYCFIHFNRVQPYFLEHGHNSYFKLLVNSNICVILRLVSVDSRISCKLRVSGFPFAQIILDWILDILDFVILWVLFMSFGVRLLIFLLEAGDWPSCRLCLAFCGVCFQHQFSFQRLCHVIWIWPRVCKPLACHLGSDLQWPVWRSAQMLTDPFVVPLSWASFLLRGFPTISGSLGPSFALLQPEIQNFGSFALLCTSGHCPQPSSRRPERISSDEHSPSCS